MIRFSSLFALLAVALLLSNCKSSDSVTPASTTAELLVRKWDFNEFVIQTDAKQYSLPPETSLITFMANGTYSYTESNVAKSGKWVLSNGDKTLTITDADGIQNVQQITSLTSTAIELGSIKVDITKSDDPSSTKYTPEEQYVYTVGLLSLLSLDKQNGGTIDFTKEPKPKSMQLIVKGKAI